MKLDQSEKKSGWHISFMAMLLVICLMMVSLVGCNSSSEKEEAADLGAVANDYYIDLTDLGMKLTIYLRIKEEGSFQFSNTTDFEVDKSSGTIEKSEDGYIMVYSSVNGEEKSISDGLTSKFTVSEDGSLDFTSCEKIYYGSASATTTSADNPDAKLVAFVIPEDYESPDVESEFSMGVYKAEYTAQDGSAYTYYAGFYEDNSYLLLAAAAKDGRISLLSEVGSYGVSTSQLALTPEGKDRISCEIVSAQELSVSVPLADNIEEREVFSFVRAEEEAPLIASLSGIGDITGTDDHFDMTVNLYADGRFEAVAGDFQENGLLFANSEEGLYKLYPDHPTEGIRGAKQVTTVPSDVLSFDENGNMILADFRARTSEGLSRDKCTLTENK